MNCSLVSDNDGSLRAAARATILACFPTADPGFIDTCLAHHLASPIPTGAAEWTLEALVCRVTDKLCESHDEFPQVGRMRRRATTSAVSPDSPAGITTMKRVRDQWRRTGSRSVREERNHGNATPSTSAVVAVEPVVDLTLSRNIALVRLHAMFPLVPVREIRDLLLELEHSFLHHGVDRLLDRSHNRQRPTPSPWHAFTTYVTQIFRLSPTPPTPRDTLSRSTPLLTRHDLFRTPRQDLALIAHFDSMFPSLTDAQSRRGRTGIDAAVAQGGIYASIKGRLEELVTEQEREDNEDSFRWWKKLVRPYNKLSRPGQAPVRRQAVATIDSCIRDEFDQYLRDQGGSEQDTDDADLDTEASISQRADGIVECECCYTNVTASADSTITCSAASPHSFCRGCIVSLASSYAFGQSALSLPLLDSSPPNLGIPCPSTSICGAAFSVFALRRFLPSATLSALSRAARVQQVEQVLRDLPPDTVTAQCPECLYTELAEPAPNPLLLLLPLYSSPLEVPFDPLQLLEYTASTIIGFASFLLLNIVAIVIVVFFPNRKTGALYSSYFASTPLSIARDRASLLELLVADFDSPISSTRVLALKPHLLPHTRPHRIPIVALEWVKALTESVSNRKRGRCTVFRCKNTPSGEAIPALDSRTSSLQDILQAEAELGDLAEDIAEERVRKIGQKLSEGTGIWTAGYCGRYSCLLCSVILNPAAPSLHTCTSATKASESPLKSLRLAIENAASEAVRRICRRCGASSVKESGCNKVICRCGQAFCWSCRSDIPAAVGYQHFCQHFTRPGQDCDECTKCMLYKEPDEKALVRSAICAARDRWIAEHPQQASELEGVDLGPIFAGVRDVVPKLSVAEKLTTGFELLALKLLALSVRPR